MNTTALLSTTTYASASAGDISSKAVPSAVQSSPQPQQDGTANTTLDALSTLLLNRHSTRAFLPIPVPTEALHKALQLAQLAPSNSNIQNWSLHLVSGKALERLTSRLSTAAQEAEPKIPPLPHSYKHFRSELGHKIYGEGYGVARSDLAGKIEKERRNFRFFDAPVAGIVCMNSELANHDAMSVGMWLQSLLLAWTAQGLASCVEVSVAGYADLMKRELEIGEGMDVLCGVAIGYEDPGEKVNEVRIGRRNWRESIIEISK
jgi:nitroreductase